MSLSVDVQLDAGEFHLNVSFEAGQGTTAILGRSGAGKSLTLRAIAGLARRPKGRITLDGVPLLDSQSSVNVPARQRGVGYVFQDYALFPHLTVAKNIAFGLPGSDRNGKATVSGLIETLGLTGLEERYPVDLSGGERQRVAFGRALAPKPRLLLLDEPFSALDSPTREALTHEFLALRDRVSVPTLLVTHDISEAYALSQHLVLLQDGSVIQSGPREQVFDLPASPEAAALVGYQNTLEGTRIDAGTVVAGGIAFRLIEAPESITIGVRAHDLVATPDPTGPARLDRIVDRGTHILGWFHDASGSRVVASLDRSLLTAPTTMRWRLATVASPRVAAWRHRDENS